MLMFILTGNIINNFILVIHTIVYNNNNEISLHFNPMRLSFINYSVQLSQVLPFTCDLMLVWWQRPKYVVTLNKINIHNTSCVLTYESLLVICNQNQAKSRNFGDYLAHGLTLLQYRRENCNSRKWFGLRLMKLYTTPIQGNRLVNIINLKCLLLGPEQ